MTIHSLITRLKAWAESKFSGIVHIHFHEGGIRKVRIEHDLTE